MRKLLLILAMLLMVAGVGVLIYPHIQQQLYRRYANALIDDFRAQVEAARAEHRQNSNGGNPGGPNGGSSPSPNGPNNGNNPADGGDPADSYGPADEEGRHSGDPLNWMYLMMTERNRELYDAGRQTIGDPFTYAEPEIDLSEFGIPWEIIGYIEIPRMNVSLPIFLGASDDNLMRGAAHMSQTSLPVGGINTNSAIAAHRGLGTAAMFRDIEYLHIGDEIIITNFMETLRYRVTDMQIVWPTEVGAVAIQPGRDMITLVTCHPYRRNFQRYLVFAERIE